MPEAVCFWSLQHEKNVLKEAVALLGRKNNTYFTMMQNETQFSVLFYQSCFNEIINLVPFAIFLASTELGHSIKIQSEFFLIILT